jgi:O-acetyl-ADP-ribose deacetylase (regulator of RNase III)
MPTGSLGHALEELPFGVEAMLALRERFLVSLEAVAIRLARTSADPVAAFAARHASDESSGHFEIEYAIPSPAWRIPRLAGRRVPPDSIIGDVSAVGFTARSSHAESWGDGLDAVHIEAVGAPPYPDGVRPRVVGLLWPSGSQPSRAGIHYERGDALSPIGSGSKLIAHVVNDKAAAWGGRSFAAQVRAKWPAVQATFKTWAAEQGLHLGAIHVAEAQDHIGVVSMVAQHGYRPASRPLIRYDALQRALGALADLADAEGASVHMPRIGTGNAGGNWEFIGGLVEELVVARGIHVTVYDFPSPDPTRSGALRQATR